MSKYKTWLKQYEAFTAWVNDYNVKRDNGWNQLEAIKPPPAQLTPNGTEISLDVFTHDIPRIKYGRQFSLQVEEALAFSKWVIENFEEKE